MQEYRLANKDVLLALYDAHPNNEVNTVAGWPTSYYYWSSTPGTGSEYDFVYLLNGNSDSLYPS